MDKEVSAGSVLVADDDDALRALLTRTLTRQGYVVRAVSNGDDAAATFDLQPIDLVLSDIDMPGRSGVELLRAIRARDLDVPVVLMTGQPSLETAMSAVEFGASHYLTKPVDPAQLHATVQRAIHAGRLARARRQLVELGDGDAPQISDLAGLSARFEKAMAGLFIVWQPIVRWSDRSTFAYEGLARSAEPAIASAGALLDAAERLEQTTPMSRRLRALCADGAAGAGDALLFVNVLPTDLLDEALYDPSAPLTQLAHRTTLEITERARLELVSGLPGRIDRLRALGFRIAIDDIGAGYAGLTSFAALEPDFMKLDRALVQGIDRSKTKRQLVAAMIRACDELGVKVIGEGVETPNERDALIGLGCDLLQGFLFARPSRPFVTPSF